jgi:hypothetical protein
VGSSDEIRLVRDPAFRAVATCTVCGATLAQGPTGAEPHLAAYALGMAMGIELCCGEPSSAPFHLGPACAGGLLRITIEELKDAIGSPSPPTPRIVH